MSDLISRSKVIDILEKEKSLRCGYDADIAIFSIEKGVRELPTAYSVAKVVEELEKIRAKKTCNKEKCDTKEICRICVVDDAIEIVKQGGVSGASDDVCEYKIKDEVVYASCNNKQIASAFCWFNECGDYKYCPYCVKKIKVVG